MEVTNLILAYAALWLAVFIHEIGHFGKHIYFRYSRLVPVMSTSESRFPKYGGLIASVIVFILIYLYKPNHFLTLIGLMAFLHFLSYALIEPLFPLRNIIHSGEGGISDIKQGEYWFLVVGLIAIYLYGNYYFQILIGLF